MKLKLVLSHRFAQQRKAGISFSCPGQAPWTEVLIMSDRLGDLRHGLYQALEVPDDEVVKATIREKHLAIASVSEHCGA